MNSVNSKKACNTKGPFKPSPLAKLSLTCIWQFEEEHFLFQCMHSIWLPLCGHCHSLFIDHNQVRGTQSKHSTHTWMGLRNYNVAMKPPSPQTLWFFFFLSIDKLSCNLFLEAANGKFHSYSHLWKIIICNCTPLIFVVEPHAKAINKYFSLCKFCNRNVATVLLKIIFCQHASRHDRGLKLD